MERPPHLLGRLSLTKRDLVPASLLAAYILLMSYLSILRYDTFTDAWDFGGYVQALFTATKGKLFEYTINSFFYVGFPNNLLGSFLGVHFSPILFAIVPLYALAPFPETLLILQTFVLGLGGVPVYLLAKKKLGFTAGVTFLAMYLIYPPLIGLNLNDFHVEAFLPTLMLFGINFGLEREWRRVAVAFVLAALVIEEAGVLVSFAILFLLVYHKAWTDRRKLGLYIGFALLPILYAFAAINARPMFGLDPNGFTRLLNGENYLILGASSALDVPLAALLSPSRGLTALAFDPITKLEWIGLLFGPVPFSLLFPEGLLLAFPWLGVALLSNYAGYYSIYGMHQAFLMYAVFPSAILGLARIGPWKKRRLKASLTVALVLSLSFSFVADFPSSIYGNSFILTRHTAAEQAIVNLVPDGASILTTSDIFPHVANRFEAYLVPPPLLRPSYSGFSAEILAHVNPKFILLDLGSTSGIIWSENLAILEGKVYTSNYGVVGYSDKVLLLEANETGLPRLYHPDSIFNATNLIYDTRVTHRIQSDALSFPPGTHSNSAWFGPYTYLPAGNYTVEFTLKLNGSVLDNIPVIILDAAYGNLKIIAAIQLQTSNFSATGWSTFDLNFSLKTAVYDLQLRGMYPTPQVGIILRGIEVRPS